MTVLTESARLPIFSGTLVPHRIDVGSNGDTYPYPANAHVSLNYGSPMDSFMARNVSLAPMAGFVFKTIRFPKLREVQYPDQYMEIRGTVVNSSDSPLERQVLLLTRDGILIREVRSAADGTFSIKVDDYSINQTLVIAIPDDGDVRNAVVKWGVVGVTPL